MFYYIGYSMKVLAFGEILWDIIERDEHLGGAPFNFIAHIAQCGDDAYIVSRVGADFRGMKALNRCKAYGVSDRYIQHDENLPTGIVEVTLNNGQPDYLIVENVAWDNIAFEDSLKNLEDEHFDVFYYGTLAQRGVRSAETLEKILTSSHFGQRFCDINLRKTGYNVTVIRRALSHATMLKLNHEEIPVVSSLAAGTTMDIPTFCSWVSKEYSSIALVIVTAAEKGCFVWHNGRLITVPGVPVQVVDAVGAGDSFSAAFLHVFMRTGNPELAGRVANGVGAFVATQRGAIPTYTRDIRQMIGTSA
ncbi:PfkB family carbohydrate kinase [Chryseolinea sp. T2]|uniref:PfkB family carbohydrate kinase n=1 Tax=Chryseolinea sp. T2 TaxID=3129255 RepID=UPI0030771207